MENIQNGKPYRISTKTLAILPKYDVKYASAIIETDSQLLRKEPPIDIIKENCLHYGSSYEGRRASIIYHLSFHQKTPIPISPERGIFSFPSRSPAVADCEWLFTHGINAIKEMKRHSEIDLVNGKRLITDVSVHILKEQWRRTGICQIVLK